MKIAFRVDASSQIGTGHFMRCLTLADGLKQRGARIRFVSRNLPAHLCDMLAAKNMEYVSPASDAIPSPVNNGLAHAHWLGTSQTQDAQATIQALSDQSWDWLIVDHYALDSRWESMLKQTAKKILVIDDIADRLHDCNILLDQNFYTDMNSRYIGKVSSECQLLLGPSYALLRDEFRQLHKQIKPRNEPVKRILVFFGGVDADNYTGHAIAALSKISIPDLDVDVVIGAQHPDREQIEAACAQHGFFCHVQTTRMAELMAAADLAIGAGGVATWERCCLGLPTLAICTADNQQRQVADAALEGLLYSPAIKGDLNQAFQRHIHALIENSYLRQLISRNNLQAVDGRGIMRVITSMGSGDIEMRIAGLNDSEKLFQWRNHSSIRAVSRNAGLIDWQDHQKWFASVLADPEKMLLIGHRAESPVGVVRFDLQNDEAEVSIYLVPDAALFGQGRILLQSAEQWLLTNYPKIRRIRAHVLGGNVRSQRLFVGAGYQIESSVYTKKLH